MGNLLPMLILCADVEVLYVFANMPNGKHTARTKVLNCGGARGEEPQMNAEEPAPACGRNQICTRAETPRRRGPQIVTVFLSSASLRLRAKSNLFFTGAYITTPRLSGKDFQLLRVSNTPRPAAGTKYPLAKSAKKASMKGPLNLGDLCVFARDMILMFAIA